jgi:uncharacterized membrane protein YjjP (DUF1212 family)
VQQQLARVAGAYGAADVRISAFPTFMMVSMGRGEPTALEITTSSGSGPRLDQLAALDRLVREAERGEVLPTEGIRRLDEIVDMATRYPAISSILGYSAFTVGLCLILQPAARDVAAAAVLGALVGLLRWLVRRPSPLQVLLPVFAAFSVSALSALAARQDLTGPGLRAMVASLVVFLPGAALTTAVLELAGGQAVSGASRLVAGIVQLALLAFGIVAGVEVVGVPFALVARDTGAELGSWAPWLGVLIFAIGVVVANSAPGRSLPSLLVVLYVAWSGQVVGNALIGATLSAFIGALAMTPVATWVSRLPHALPPHASFLPGFWLLVPGALGLIGLTQVAGDADSAGIQDLGLTVVSIFAVALGVLCGTLLLGWTTPRSGDGTMTGR